MKPRSLLIALLLYSAPVAAAQDSASLAQAIGTLHHHQNIRLETYGGDRFFGRYLGSGADTVTVSTPLSPGWRTVHIDTLTRVWVQHGTQVIVGGVIGALIAGSLLYSFGNALCDGRCGGPVVAARSAAIGAGLGMALGILIPCWKPVFPAP